MDIASELRAFIIEEAAIEEAITEDTLLFSDGYVDSLTLAAIVAWVQERFGVAIPPSRFTLEHMDSIRAMTATIRDLQAQA